MSEPGRMLSSQEVIEPAMKGRVQSSEGTLNVDTGGSSGRKNTVYGTSDASDQPAEIGGRGFDSPPPVSASSGRVRSTYESPTKIHRSTSGRVQAAGPSLTAARLAEAMAVTNGWDRFAAMPSQDQTTYLRWAVRIVHHLNAPARTPTPDATP